MNIYIIVDLEGINGVYSREQLLSDRFYGEEGRNLITADVNVCAEACKEAGAERVYVRDAHSSGEMIRWDRLSPAIDYIIRGGAGRPYRFAGLEDCDAVILLGYHAMSDTEGALLSHTMSPHFHYYYNDVEHGEIGLDAAMAGECGKPVIMVSGCDHACAEAKRFLPWVTTCVTKKALGHEQALLPAADKGYALLRQKTIEACHHIAACRPYVITPPIRARVEIPDRPVREGVINSAFNILGL